MSKPENTERAGCMTVLIVGLLAFTVLGAVALLTVGPADAAPTAQTEASIVAPEPNPEAVAEAPFITGITGRPAYGMTVRWSDGNVWHVMTRSEHRTLCREESTPRKRARCQGRVDAQTWWMRETKRALRYSTPGVVLR